MGEIQDSTAVPENETAPEGQASLVVGKIPAGEGLWGALEAITTCDPVRNGALVVFSHECSGRLGVFCNKYLTGGIVDSNGDTGIRGLRQLLAVKSGMFCYRPCFGDETAELGQQIALSIHEVLSLRHGEDPVDNPSDTLQRIKISQIQAALADDFLGDVADSPVESTLVITGSLDSADAVVKHPSKEKPADKSDNKSADATPADYLDWFEKAEADEKTPNLRKILFPVMQKGSKAKADEKPPSDRELFRQVLQEEEEKVRKDIERTMERAQNDMSQKQTLDDMQLLAGMLQQQEQLLDQRWQGLDAIPTPKTGGGQTWVDSSGQTRQGAPVRSKKEFLAGCEDLVNSSVHRYDPKQFLKKVTDDEQQIKFFWLNHPRILAGGLCAIFIAAVFLVYTQMVAGDVNICLQEGKENMRAERWSSAELSFTDALSKDPKCGTAYFYRGIAREENGLDQAAEKDFLAAQKLGTPWINIAIAQAGVALRREQWDKAIEICNQAIVKGTRTAAIYRLRGNANSHLADFESARKDYDEALKYCKDDNVERAKILADRGFARVQLKDYMGGAADFDEALKQKPSKELYMLKASAFRKVKKWADAVTIYSDAIELDPNNYDAYVARGMSRMNLHQDTDALKDFGRAIQIRPNGVEALIQRGSLQLTNGAYRLAINDLQLAYNLNPTIDEARQKLMQAYAHEKREVPKALLLTDKSTSSMKLPADPEQLIAIGYNEMNQGNLDGAIDCLIMAVKKVPNNVDARRYLAHAFAKCGSFEAASTQFAAVAGMQGGMLSQEDSSVYANALEKQRNYKGAADVLARALILDPTNFGVRMRLAQLYYQAGQMQAGDQMVQQGLSVTTTPGEKQQLMQLMKQGRDPQFKTNYDTGTHG